MIQTYTIIIIIIQNNNNKIHKCNKMNYNLLKARIKNKYSRRHLNNNNNTNNLKSESNKSNLKIIF